MSVSRFDPARLDGTRVTQRRLLLATLTLLLVGPAVLLMADLHWRTGMDNWKLLHLLLFALLFALVAFGAVQALLGWFCRLGRGDPNRILRSLGPGDEDGPVDAPTAIVMPIFNEDTSRIMEGLRVIYRSLEATGQLDAFDFFILSDTTNPNRWIEEESSWVALTRQLGARGRMFYRKRRVNLNKKAGNLADFCRRWGKRYRYMVVLDADSIMTGDAIVKLVRLMERNPGAGIIQTVPRLVGGETIFARLQQFASRLYGPIFAAGLNYWQQGEANYWGHNAIIRVAPFIEHCSLPELPGVEPFGGRILSHDYVEAALMRRAGWSVWLAVDLEGSYEECPGNLIDFAKRDRRWLQGNLQHAWLLTARGLHAANRLHLALGILAYLASPLWLAFLVVSTVIAWRYAATGLSPLPIDSFARYLRMGFHAQALLLLFGTLGLLFLPKVLALFDLARRPGTAEGFGGWWRVVGSAVAETAIFTLIAPVLMLFHSKFIVLTLAGKGVAWVAQRRGADGDPEWREAILTHAGHTVVGLGWGTLALRINPAFAAWLSPILLGLVTSIPVSLVTGQLAGGRMTNRLKLFLTPEESAPPPELQRLARNLEACRRHAPPLPELAADYGLMQAVLDPYVNAVHLALLREREQAPDAASEERFAPLRDRLLREGPGSLPARDKLALLLDADSMAALHRDLWSLPAERLSSWWRTAIRAYNVLAPAPQTALYR
jgi:membrane glycosyltransferase